MEFFKKSSKQNYDVLSSYSWYTPGVKGMFVLFALLLVGSVLGSLASLLFSLFFQEGGSDYATLISYPLMFIPAMIYTKLSSEKNSIFDTGYALDSNNFGKPGGISCAILAVIGTIALAFCADGITCLLPPMPKILEDALASLTEGKLWVNFLSVSIFAPIFEEWLCRGMVLRGLLNCPKKVKPANAIIISAVFFAVIHMNPWQAIPAFILGCIMGYVYYRTGSLKLTMLMHFANNTMALALGQSDKLSEYDSFVELLGAKMYLIAAAACVIIVILVLRAFSKVELKRIEGNSDVIEASE